MKNLIIAFLLLTCLLALQCGLLDPESPNGSLKIVLVPEKSDNNGLMKTSETLDNVQCIVNKGSKEIYNSNLAQEGNYFNAEIKDLKPGNDYSVLLYGKLSNNSIIARGYKSAVNVEAGEQETVNIVWASFSPNLISPANESILTNNIPKFDWTDVSGAVSYELQVDNDNSFSSPEISQNNLSVSEHTTTTSLSDDNFYWRIRCKDSQGNWGGWSSVFDFTILISNFNSPPNIPHDPYPENGAASIPITNVSLMWKGGDPDYYSTVNYDVLVGESADALFAVSNNQPDSTYPMTLLKYNKKYFWKIIAQDDYGNKTEGPIWNFETLSPETTFSGSFDTDNQNEVPSSLKWTVWRSSADIFVTDEFSWNNQGKSVCFIDSTLEGSSYLAASVEEKKVGMFQFHFLMTSQDDYFGIRMYSEFADSNHLGPQISLREGKLQYFDKGRKWQTVKPVENDTWCFLQLVFDCDQQFYNIYLDEKLVAEKVTWTGTMVPKLNLFYFLTFGNRKCNKAYIDDVKFFSDP